MRHGREENIQETQAGRSVCPGPGLLGDGRLRALRLRRLGLRVVSSLALHCPFQPDTYLFVGVRMRMEFAEENSWPVGPPALAPQPGGRSASVEWGREEPFSLGRPLFSQGSRPKGTSSPRQVAMAPGSTRRADRVQTAAPWTGTPTHVPSDCALPREPSSSFLFFLLQ